MAKKIIEKQNVEIPAQIDNTKTYNTKNNTFIRNEGIPNPNILPSDSPLGLMPLVGDALQVLDIPFNIENKQYGMAALNAGMLFVPNLIEKPIRWISKGIKSRKLAKALNKVELKPMKSNTDLNGKTIKINDTKTALNDAILFENALKDLNRTEQIKRFNAFAKKYGYEEIGEGVSDEVLDKVTKKMLERHNTYFRGVMPSEEVTNLATKLGISEEEALKIAATTPRAGETHIFVSPTNNARIYGRGEHVAQVRRPYELGNDRTQWFNEANFEITPGIYSKGNEDIIDPWFSPTISTTEIPNELLMKKGEFVDWVKEPLEGKGSNNKIFTKYDKLLGVYEPEDLVKFKFGGMKQDKIFKLKGGVAIPLDNKKRLFYLRGAKHEQGGIDITPELEAEGGEVVKINPKSIKVVTAQKIMGGKSPAELVVDSASTGKQDKVFNKVFNYQEEFKDRYKLNDDGTSKARFGILKKFKNWLFNIPSGFERVKENDSPTKEASEFIENDIAKRQESFYKIAKEKGHDSEPYFIPYVDDKEIIINGAGRASSNMLDSLAVNSKKAKVPFVDALGLAVEETKMGAIPNMSTKAWEDLFIKTNGRKPNNDEIKEFENKVLNSSFARNFGGIHPQFLINDHEWFKRGWEDSNKYKNMLKDIKSPLQHGLTLYKLGLYNSGDKYHKTKVQSAGNKAIKSKDVQNWLKTSEYAKQIEQYKLGGQMKKQYKNSRIVNVPSTGNKKKAYLGTTDNSQYFDVSNISVGNLPYRWNKKISTGELSETDALNAYKNEIINKGSNVVTNVQNLYQNPYALKQANKYNRYAIRKGADTNMIGFSDLNTMIVDPNVSGSSFTYKDNGIQRNIKLTGRNDFQSIIGNEIGRTRNLFNTYENDGNGVFGGQQITKYIHPQAQRLLKSKTFENSSDLGVNQYSTIANRYNDLMGLRAKLSSHNINPGNNGKYNRTDLQRYLSVIDTNDRFSKGADFKIGKIKRALNKVYRFGGEIDKKKAKLGVADWVNIGVNSAGALTNLITGLTSPDIRYARMKDPIPVMAPKINSNVNTTAEESAINEAFNDEIRSINENTASSKVALNRKRRAVARKASAKVKVRSAAENTKRDLINKGNILKGEYDKYNIGRQEQVDAYNAQAEAAEFNANKDKVGDAISGFIGDLGQGASTIANVIEQRKANENNAILTALANPNINIENIIKEIPKIREALNTKKIKKIKIKKVKTKKQNNTDESMDEYYRDSFEQ